MRVGDVFLPVAKSERYYFDMEAAREPGRAEVLRPRGSPPQSRFWYDESIAEFVAPKFGEPSNVGGPFGTVIECEDGLVVIRSDDEQVAIAGEPANWRLFPRSKHYANHLHIIYGDRLEVWSFNHDYLLDQQKKRIGIVL